MTELGCQQLIESQLAEMFDAFASGLDVSPAALFRLEGRMQDAVNRGVCDVASLREFLVNQAENKLGSDAAEEYRQSSGLCLFMHMRRAPVYPSTRK